MTTHAVREHMQLEEVPKASTKKLWQYVNEELEFLTRDDQRRVPQSVALAIRELSRRSK
jgi:hypothetical protein